MVCWLFIETIMERNVLFFCTGNDVHRIFLFQNNIWTTVMTYWNVLFQQFFLFVNVHQVKSAMLPYCCPRL